MPENFRLMEMPKRLIVAEDMVAVRIPLVAQIRDLGYDVIAECQNGLELVARCKELRPDVVVTDVNMPHLSGVDAMEKVMSLGLLDIGFVLITMHNEIHLIREYIMRGASGYVIKGQSNLGSQLDSQILLAFKPVLAYRHGWKIREAIRLLQKHGNISEEEARKALQHEANKRQVRLYVAAEEIQQHYERLIP